MKDCMFQYATKQRIFEDTGLITRNEADKLWSKYIIDCQSRWNEIESPQMIIWINCNTETHYHTIGKELDYYSSPHPKKEEVGG